jgi:quaternary ammonium compound-resistance protein SugE
LPRHRGGSPELQVKSGFRPFQPGADSYYLHSVGIPTGVAGRLHLRKWFMPWILLFIAGLFEVAWAIGLKYTEGFTRFWPSAGTLAAMTLSIVLLGLAMRTLPVGTAYAVWTGIGAVGTVILGIVLFAEPATAARLACVGLIVAGILGLKLTSAV